MDLSFPSRPAGPPPSDALWVAFGRAAALVTLGIGVGVVSSLAVGGAGSLPSIVSVVAGSAAALVAYLRPRRPSSLVVADVLLSLAVLASTFGRLGVLYLPCLLAFLAVTARTERRPAEASPAPEPLAVTPEHRVSSPPDRAPAVRQPSERLHRPPDQLPTAEEFFARDPVATPRRASRERRPDAVVIVAPRPPGPALEKGPAEQAEPPDRGAGRHRAPSTGSRAADVARRAGSTLRERARAGLQFVRTHLEADDLPPGIDEPGLPTVPEPEGRSPVASTRGPDDRAPMKPRIPQPPVDPTGAAQTDDPMEAFMLERVAVGASMTSLTYKPYGQLRFLPPPRPRREDPGSEWAIGDEENAGWSSPGWRTLGDP